MKELIIATKNKGKVKEFTVLFERYGIKVKSLLDFTEEMNDIEETGTTFEANASLKAEEISNLLNLPVLADDSGLVIEELNGRPGIYSARYAGEPTNDKRNNEKVLSEMIDLEDSKRSAYFNCVLALAIPGQETLFFYGKCSGKITTVPAGDNGFGYDPIFIPKGYNQTMAQLDETVKNKISHRYQAIVQLTAWLDNHIEKVF